MEEQINPLALTHLLQHTLRSLCIHESSQWVYAVFWRILPRNFPPPKWDIQEGGFDRLRGNRRNWILVWEDGFCNFAASSMVDPVSAGDCAGSSLGYSNYQFQPLKGLQPELFFKMSHEIYNYGDGLIGKVAADRSHKWVYNEPNIQEINCSSAWNDLGDSQPRTWEAQFQSGIKTIALIAVREGVIQLGAVHKVMEDPNYIISLRKKFCYIESIPGVLLPHPSSSMPSPYELEGYGTTPNTTWPFHSVFSTLPPPTAPEFYHNDYFINHPLKVTPSMSALEALLSKLPSVGPTPSPSSSSGGPHQRLDEVGEVANVAKEEIDDEYMTRGEIGESSNSISHYYHQHQHQQYQHLNLNNSKSNNKF